jgi:hypothetical protein
VKTWISGISIAYARSSVEANGGRSVCGHLEIRAHRAHVGPVKGPLDVRDRDVARAVTLADWLDDRYLDPLIGFVLPGVGDLAMATVGLYAVWVALRHRFPAIVVARMLRNLAIDLLVGAIPFLGDLFDFVWKAHRMNADLLLERHELGPSPLRDWAVVIGSALALLVALAAPFVVLAFLIQRFW